MALVWWVAGLQPEQPAAVKGEALRPEQQEVSEQVAEQRAG
jgi:hypothetical protein